MHHGDFQFWTPVEVRWADMDNFGHVNNAKYFTYIETARFAYFTHTGVTGFWKDGFAPILASIHCDFRQPIVFPADLEIGVRTAHLGNSSIKLESLLTVGSRQNTVATSKALVVWFNYEKNQSTPIPDDMRKLLT